LDANQTLQQMLQPGGFQMALFPPASRYHGLETKTRETPEGKTIIYLRRRFVPPRSTSSCYANTWLQGERLDNITASYLGTPSSLAHLRCEQRDASG
jgi:hypothetical protein